METHRKLDMVKTAYNPNIGNSRQEDKEFEGSVSYILIACFKKPWKCII